MRNSEIRAAICSLSVCGLLCGCGVQADGVVLVGENGAEASRAESASGEADRGNAAEEAGEPSSAEAGQTPRIYVYVCGAVNSPGVVILQEGSRAEAALEAAGGFRQDARTDYVNLAAKVTDGEKLYFPTVEEAVPGPEESAGDGLVNINTADEETLCTLPGIGQSRARDILRYREENGPFESGEDIMNVPGIKSSVYGKIKDKIKVE